MSPMVILYFSIVLQKATGSKRGMTMTGTAWTRGYWRRLTAPAIIVLKGVWIKAGQWEFTIDMIEWQDTNAPVGSMFHLQDWSHNG